MKYDLADRTDEKRKFEITVHLKFAFMYEFSIKAINLFKFSGNLYAISKGVRCPCVCAFV